MNKLKPKKFDLSSGTKDLLRNKSILSFSIMFVFVMIRFRFWNGLRWTNNDALTRCISNNIKTVRLKLFSFLNRTLSFQRRKNFFFTLINKYFCSHHRLWLTVSSWQQLVGFNSMLQHLFGWRCCSINVLIFNWNNEKFFNQFVPILW